MYQYSIHYSSTRIDQIIPGRTELCHAMHSAECSLRILLICIPLHLCRGTHRRRPPTRSQYFSDPFPSTVCGIHIHRLAIFISAHHTTHTHTRANAPVKFGGRVRATMPQFVAIVCVYVCGCVCVLFVCVIKGSQILGRTKPKHHKRPNRCGLFRMLSADVRMRCGDGGDVACS